MTPTVTEAVRQALDQFVAGMVAAAPKLLAGAVFLALAAVVIRAVVWIVGSVVARATAQDIYVQFARTVAGGFLWFGALLGFLTLVGLPDIAASLGTASGFLALGVSYALSGMIADAVAGVYLIRDPDFQVGDHVTAGDTEGVVTDIELRKTRFAVDDDVVVRANAEVEKKWRKREHADGAATE